MSNKPDYLLNSRIIVKPIKSMEEKVGKILIPATANADLEAGIAIQVDKDIEQWVSIGDTVIFAKGAGQGQLINGDPHIWIELREVWGGFKNSEGE